MLVRTSALFTIALAAIAIAVPSKSRAYEDDGGHCNTGNLSCCNVVQSVRPLNDIPLLFLTRRLSRLMIPKPARLQAY